MGPSCRSKKEEGGEARRTGEQLGRSLGRVKGERGAGLRLVFQGVSPFLFLLFFSFLFSFPFYFPKPFLNRILNSNKFKPEANNTK